ncbi:hypothetical protein [Vacuolonema iberomarrocanum]|uniref:hypothetical protein n=1 Tax=Vacuolonema iberomarrocanum TaxID=3454632 RepID=UPI001A08DB29|nr:hypothetical protein [filamentous cyanobacterium LEGE 07170]
MPPAARAAQVFRVLGLIAPANLVLIMLPAFFISLSTLEWQSSYLEVLGMVVVLCGFLSAILGKSSLKPLIQFLESIPTVF